MTLRTVCLTLALCCCAAWCQVVEVPNPSFEAGETKPSGWTLSGGSGERLEGDAPDGQRCVSVTGSGKDSTYWRTGPLALAPSSIYRVEFKARSLGGAGGTPITGPVFCNRDLQFSEKWRSYSSVFFTPRDVKAAGPWLRFGQWHVNGGVAYDEVRVVRVQPAYSRVADLTLGQGERVSGASYEFKAPFFSTSRNQSRPLLSSQCGFNTYRWVFGSGSDVVYRHRIGDRNQTEAEIKVEVSYHTGGELAVDVSRDGKDWRQIGVQGEVGELAVPVPADLLPAPEVRVRLRAQARQKVGTDSDPGSFQVSGYRYQVTLDGAPLEARGATRFLALSAVDPNVEVTIADMGEGLPGGRNEIVMRLNNRTQDALEVTPVVRIEQDELRRESRGEPVRIAPGAHVLRCPYPVPSPGAWRLTVDLRPGVNFCCSSDLYVSDYFDVSYGELLPGTSPGVALWWAHSGWKIPRTRPLPAARGAAVLVRAARNETDAAQLVLRPAQALRGLTARAGDLAGPGGARLAAERVEVLRVRYVPVEQPTDGSGVAAPWPDPLPPFKGPIDVEPGTNQPLWVRVNVPRDAAPGRYEGSVELSAQGWSAKVPLRVDVYDFELPDRMTCTTAFGFGAAYVWRYQKISDPAQRRAVLEKYWRNFAAHHISPYDLAPLDPFKVVWPKTGDWGGGARDRSEKRSGESSLRLCDDKPEANVSAPYAKNIPIPKNGFRFRFWCKTGKPGHEFIVTLNHHDAAGGWMSGRNRDMRVQGSGEWQPFDRTVTRFPEGAKSVRVTLWATLYRGDGALTGTVWYDDVSLQELDNGAECLEGGGFEPVDPALLKPEIDWAAWDGAMARAIDHHHFNSFRLRVQGMGGGTFHARHEPSLLGFSEDTPGYKSAFANYCHAVQEHLRAKGWLDEAYVYWFDEPDPKDYEFVMNGFRKLKEAAPDVRRMLTEQVEPDLVGGPNLWCPVSHNYDHEDAEERRRAGDHFWWYVCCGPKAPFCGLFIDHAATELRVWLWQTWQRKIEGVLVWQSNYWTSGAAYPDRNCPQNPYEDPMGWVSGYSTKPGTKRPWGNGDGRFIYPPEAAASGRQAETVLEGPVDSIRWEMLRDGVEDYEYLAMLQRLLAAKGAALAPAARERYAALLEVPEAITSDMTTFTKDPAPIEERRHAVARAIVQLSRR